jgi:DNA-binding CsgD family transcriptional regulator
MSALARGDERRILGFLAEAESFGGEHPFEGEFLAQLGTLVPAQWIGFVYGPAPRYSGLVRPGDEHVADEVDWTAIDWPVLQDEVPTFAHLEHNFGVVKISDFLNLRQLRRSRAYELVLDPLGLEHWLSLRLPIATGMAQFMFDRSGRDFTERDREVLITLTPHLVRLYQAAEMRQRLRAALALQGTRPLLPQLTPREHEILELVAEGHTNREIAERLWISAGTVRKHLDNVYAKLGVHTRTAAAAFLHG